MTVRFRYTRYPSSRPPHTAGGRTYRTRPIVPITVVGPTTSHLLDGLLDTGSDDTVFPEWVAALVGIDLTNAPTSTGTGVGSVGPVPLRFAEVTLRMADNHERREWRARVGFTPVGFRHPMLGFAGVLEYFTATFHGDREEVELEINASYPGT